MRQISMKNLNTCSIEKILKKESMQLLCLRTSKILCLGVFVRCALG